MHYPEAVTNSQRQPNSEQYNLSNSREFIKGWQVFKLDRLYYVALDQTPTPMANVHFFTVDTLFVYVNFFNDFGPSNISHVVKFCMLMQAKFSDPTLKNQILVLYSSFDADKRSNAAFLISCYMMLVYRNTPEQAFQPLMGLNPPFFPYRDAGYGPATYHITILDCLRGLCHALKLGLFDLQNFDLQQYDFYERVENGDFTWITKKFLALAVPKDEIAKGPESDRLYGVTEFGNELFSAYKIKGLIRWMLANNVRTIIRLNNKTYDRTPFIEAGIEHIELYFPDGSTPPDPLLRRFLEICESREGAIAVHCKAGLGRTGSLIAAFLMKHYRLTASEIISFMRILRPGSVVGPQQNYLQALQSRLWKMTPIEPLPQSISMLTPATFPNGITRFGTALYAPKVENNQYLEVENHSLNVEVELQEADRREIEVLKRAYGENNEMEKTLENERHNLSLKSIQEFAVPIQPRRYLGGSHEQATAENEKATLLRQHQVSAQPAPKEQYQRYHLRSKSVDVQQQQQFRIRGLPSTDLEVQIELPVDESNNIQKQKQARHI